VLLIAFAWANKPAEPQKHAGRSLPQQQNVRVPERSLDDLYTCRDTPIPIPDASTIVAVIDVPTSFNVEDVDVGVTITHPWVRDLQLILERDSVYLDSIRFIDSTFVDTVWVRDTTWQDTLIDSVASVLLLDYFPGDSIVNMTDCWFDDDANRGIYEGLPPFTGGFRPLRSLDSVFAGHDAQGEWRLRVRDRFAVDVGVLESFSLELNGVVSLTGTVTNSVTGAPVTNASVLLIDTTGTDSTGADTLAQRLTGSDGRYFISRVNSGSYRMIAAATDYDSVVVDGVLIMDQQTTTRDFALVPQFDFTDVSYTGGRVFLPDTSTVTVPLEVANISSEILDLDVTLNILHTYIADLTISIVHPAGDTVILFNPPIVPSLGANMTNCRFDDEATTQIGQGTGPFTGSFVPEEPLSPLESLNPIGIWTLSIQDFGVGDTGYVEGFVLHFQSELLDADDREVGLPQAFKLHPAFPNPFNASVGLTLDVLREQAIELAVYDIMGRLTTTLHSGKLTAGSHRFVWTSVNAASGMYFVRASTLDAAQTIKIVLLK